MPGSHWLELVLKNRRDCMAGNEGRTGSGLYQPFGRAGAFALILLGTAVLVGWTFQIEILKAVLSGYVSMTVNTAISFVGAGALLLLIFRQTQPKLTRPAARLLGGLVLLMVLL